MITRGGMLVHLERGVRRGFLKGAKAYVPQRSAFAREAPSDGAFETYTNLSDHPWPVNNAGEVGYKSTDARTGAGITGSLDEGRSIRIVGAAERGLIVYNVDWEVSIGITHNAINDDRAGELLDWAESAGQRFEQHKDYLAFAALNGGDGSTYGRAYDNLTFFNDAHLDPGAEYQTSQDNSYALSLSFTNFKTVKIAASKFLDSRGQPVGYNHNLLIVPPDLEEEGAQVARNIEKSGTANRDINPYAGSVNLLVAPGGWLDSTAWYVVAAGQLEKPINLQVRSEPQLVTWDDETQGNGVRYFKWVARYNVFYGDWRLAAQGNT